MLSDDERVNKAYEELLKKYLEPDEISLFQNQKNEALLESSFDASVEDKKIRIFLAKTCGCGHDCHLKFTTQELLNSRASFQSLSTSERNCYILAQLRMFSNRSDYSVSSRAISKRQRQKFLYQIDIDRPVCRNMFLFYHGETIKRLKRLQECFIENAIKPPIHGNKGAKPANAYRVRYIIHL
jgi:hypothetical protein